MTNPRILEEKTLTLVEVKGVVKDIEKRDKELGLLSQKTKEYLDTFVTITDKDRKKSSPCKNALKGISSGFRRNESGVSELVGTLLVLTITVLLFSSIFLWVSTIKSPDAHSHTVLEGVFDLSSSHALSPEKKSTITLYRKDDSQFSCAFPGGLVIDEIFFSKLLLYLKLPAC